MPLSLPIFRATGISTTPDVDTMLAAGAPVAIGVSGGKDSCAVAFATVEHLDRIGHAGPRLLIHSDLGRVEWHDSLPTCQRLAGRLGMELVVVRRKAGDMMDRWLVRWRNNLARYIALECVKLILPWSTPAMRFCTSELKTQVICRELIRRFPGQGIVSVTGIRGEESANRAKSPISAVQNELTNTTHKTFGRSWHPIHFWTLPDVWACLESHGFARHEAYTRYGLSRVSCRYCILASAADLDAASRAEEATDLYREMVGLEIASTFSFQDSKWLGDVAPHLLTQEMREGLAKAKAAAEIREAAEARIPKHLLYTKGWPTCIPTEAEAALLCQVRREVSAAMGIGARYTEPKELIGRYRELMDLKKVGAKKRRAA